MSDSEGESRANAVGRKRNVHGELKTPSYPTSRRSSKASSKESGEISSSSDSESEDDAKDAEAPNKRSRHSPDKSAITISSSSSSSEDGEISSSHANRDSDLDISSTSGSSSDDSDNDNDSDSSSNLSHGISKMASEADDMVRLYSLSKEDRLDQRHYFNLSSPPDALVYCLCCGDRGHMRPVCPARKCTHCGAFEVHISSACPKFRKCGLCRQRGHDSRDCRNQSYRGSTSNDPCDICGEADGHAEETCSRLWCFPTVASHTQVKKIPEQAMLRGCYFCGSGEHWGDDCRNLRREDSNSVKTWSWKNAERFILRVEEIDGKQLQPPHTEEDDEDYDPLAALESGLEEANGEYVAAEDSEEEYEPPPAPESKPWRSWQMGLFDDARD